MAFAPPTVDELGKIRLRRQPQQDRSRTKVIAAIAAAEKALHKSGPDSITLNSVAKDAKISVGAIHQYLPDRQAIYAALADRYHHRIERALTDAAKKITTPEELVTIGLEAVVAAYGKEPNIHAPRMRTYTAAEASEPHREAMTDIVRDLLLRFELTDDDNSDAAARAVFAATDAILREAFVIDSIGDPRLLAQARTMCTAWLAAARG